MELKQYCKAHSRKKAKENALALALACEPCQTFYFDVKRKIDDENSKDAVVEQRCSPLRTGSPGTETGIPYREIATTYRS